MLIWWFEFKSQAMFVRNKRQGCPALMWLLTKANSTIICTWYGPWKLEIPKDTMYVPSKTQTVKSWITLDRPIWNIYIWIDVGIFHPIFLIRARVFLSKRSSYVTALFSVRAAPPYQSFWRALNHLRGLGGRWTQVEPAKWFNGAQGRSSSTCDCAHLRETNYDMLGLWRGADPL